MCESSFESELWHQSNLHHSAYCRKRKWQEHFDINWMATTLSWKPYQMAKCSTLLNQQSSLDKWSLTPFKPTKRKNISTYDSTYVLLSFLQIAHVWVLSISYCCKTFINMPLIAFLSWYYFLDVLTVTWGQWTWGKKVILSFIWLSNPSTVVTRPPSVPDASSRSSSGIITMAVSDYSTD